jgi:hypothetical protein
MADGETQKCGVDLYTKGNISILAFALRGGATNNVWVREEMKEITRDERRETFEKDSP